MRTTIAASALALTSLWLWPTDASMVRAASNPPSAPIKRVVAIERGRVWEATDVASLNLMAGPEDRKALAFDETISCTYVDKKLTGKTPKFACAEGEDDELKVKFGGDNGEVYAEVASTRLLWALGFGADHMYSVKVVCRGCPHIFNGVSRSRDESIFDPAAVERKLPGTVFPTEGWSWKELDLVDERAGGASRAERDALKLLGVFIQHSDSKPEQQRLLCAGEPKAAHPAAKTRVCGHPLMYLNDVGVTFGRANKTNDNDVGSMNLVEWSKTPVWKDPGRCVGNLPKSLTGTLDNPVISEEGRQFLAGLMTQLTDQQLHDLFAAARVTLRLRNPKDISSGFPTVDEWVAAFKSKRDQIVNAHCSTS